MVKGMERLLAVFGGAEAITVQCLSSEPKGTQFLGDMREEPSGVKTRRLRRIFQLGQITLIHYRVVKSRSFGRRVSHQYLNVPADQLLMILPVAVLYQLVQRPAHAVRASSRS